MRQKKCDKTKIARFEFDVPEEGSDRIRVQEWHHSAERELETPTQQYEQRATQSPKECFVNLARQACEEPPSCDYTLPGEDEESTSQPKPVFIKETIKAQGGAKREQPR